ncbi:MAG: hypothetical protein JWR51_3182 [Devosia sp.]|uniref:hypothetical protein n=1 Tax=Devosia sp. TaxID=1871048 RepID=UPI00262FCFA7|nr:hypothetical protein [Devosia sp.]MDB5530079.1 hypothetical protein [Devosia sp.]
MPDIQSVPKSNGSRKPVPTDGGDTEDGSSDSADSGIHLQAMTATKTVELPDLVERAQRQVQQHLRSAEQDAATYLDRMGLIDAEIDKAEQDKTLAEDQVRYWQSVQENTVHVIDVLRQRRSGPQAALDALRKNGIQG